MNTDTSVTGTDGQFPADSTHERLKAGVSGPDEIDGNEVEGVTLDFTQDDLSLAERTAWYRNFRADALNKKISPRWSRKSVLESAARSGLSGTRQQMAKIEAEYGPLPKTKAEVNEYAKLIVLAELGTTPDSEE